MHAIKLTKVEKILSSIKIQVNEKLFIKDPDSSQLGKKIVEQSIDLIDEIGFEEFTFKKLGARIGSPESTIYRYFENKHMLLVYLTSWYWTWLEYRLVFSTNNISSPEERLKRAIAIVTEPVKQDSNYSHINEVKLNRIIISESLKAYFTKEVDEANKEGFYMVYKNIVQRISEMVLDISPNFKHSHTLISTVVEGAHQQKYFSEHLPSLTDVGNNDDKIVSFFTNLVFSMLKNG